MAGLSPWISKLGLTNEADLGPLPASVDLVRAAEAIGQYWSEGRVPPNLGHADQGASPNASGPLS